MNAKELMLGDWVKSRGKIEQVREVYDGYICTDSFEDSHDYHFDPIPLTEEILQKNGFKDGQYFSELYIQGWHVISDAHNLCMECERGWHMNIPCRCVHELQHAFNLVGIRKDFVV